MHALSSFIAVAVSVLAAPTHPSPGAASPGEGTEPLAIEAFRYSPSVPLPEADLTPLDSEPPAVRTPDVPRKPVELELGSELGLAKVPLFTPTSPEPAFFAGAAWRAAPWFAVGAEATLEPAHAPRGWLAIAARTYFTDSGVVDPYAVWSVGAGSLERRAGERVERGSAWLLRAGFGVDFMLSGSLKLGPALYYTRALWEERKLCSFHACTTWQDERFALPAGFVSMALRVVWQLGDPY